MKKFILFLACLTLVPTIHAKPSPLTPAQQRAQEVLPKLQKIAQQATHLALESEPTTDRYRQLVRISSICLHAIEALHNTPPEQIEELLAIASRELSAFTSLGIRNHKAKDDIEPIALPIEEIVALIAEEHLEIHFKPTGNQLTAKRIIFHTIVELFNSFGNSKLVAQKLARQEEREKDAPPATDTLNWTESLGRAPEYLKTTFIDNRSGFALRTLRIMANRFIDKTVPNKNRTKGQKFAELLIPIAIAHVISFFISKDRDESWSHLSSNIAEDVLIRLIMVQLFIEKKNVGWVFLMIATYFLAFYNSTASTQVWDKIKKEGPDDNAFERRKKFFTQIGTSKKNMFNVLVDGASQIALYKLIDGVIMPKITIPRWLLTVPVCQQQTEHHEHIFPLVTTTPEGQP